MSKQNTRWTRQEKRNLCDLIKSGAPLKKVADQLGRTEQAVMMQALKIGINFRDHRNVAS